MPFTESPEPLHHAKMDYTGQLIVFEGPDSCGKSAIADMLRAERAKAGTQVELLAFPGQEQGTLGRLVYDLHHHHAENFGIERIAPDALQTLHIAAHLDAIAYRIVPLLASGATVILDRYWWSTVVYGSVAGVPGPILDKLIDLEHLAWAGHAPAVVFLIDRTFPLDRDHASAAWGQLRAGYHQLVRREQGAQQIRVIQNDTTENAALSAVLESLEELA